jgi:3-(3-hydroxy-phenyl)propionate hydroxylase
LSTGDGEAWKGLARIGAAPVDVPLEDPDGRSNWLLDALTDGFTALHVSDAGRRAAPEGMALKVIGEDLIDAHGLFAARYDATPDSVYLFRPDHYLCARFRAYDAGHLAAARARALARAIGKPP